MDSNKDESDRCIQLAERYIEVGYREQAEKFLLKAEVLYPSQKAKDLFTITKYMPFKKGITHVNSATEQEINPKLCLPKTSENTLGISDATVTRIHRSRDYYEMLGITKSSSHVRIKKAYRKLALQLHPDKNKRAGAAEAFKIIRNAVAVLTDNEKRKMYDLYGMDEMNSYKLNSDDSSPNSSDSTIPFRKYSQAAESQQKETCQFQERTIYAVIQFLPILLAIGLSLVSSMMVAESNHCTYPSIKYPMVRMTYNLKIPYYVKHNFWAENSPLTIRRIEMNIEEDHINFLQNACYSEKCYRQCFSLLYYNLYSYFKYLGYY